MNKPQFIEILRKKIDEYDRIYLEVHGNEEAPPDEEGVPPGALPDFEKFFIDFEAFCTEDPDIRNVDKPVN